MGRSHLPLRLLLLAWLALASAGCKLPYRTLAQVLVVPYASLEAEGNTVGSQCLRAPSIALAVPPEAAQLQVRAAILRLEVKNEGPARLVMVPHLTPRGEDPYAQASLGGAEPIELAGLGSQAERSYPLSAAMFKTEAWSFGLRVTSPEALPAAPRASDHRLEVRWRVDVDASLL
ncbi:MAG: hypothetical protein VKS61_06040 [Candidatus Sericytochromatia bacterium]|nr:hypothetical protein [Candidatus Sericytochromatia bacterium]